MKVPRHIQQLSEIGPVYLVGGSVRDHILARSCDDHDFVVQGDAKGFAQKVADRLGARVIEIGKAKKTNYRIVSGENVLDFADMAGPCIEADLVKRDFTINALAFDLGSQRLIDPLAGKDDITSGIVRLVSDDAVAADPVRMLRAFRFAALLDFSIASETLAVIKKERGRIVASAQERICAELFKIMEVDRSFKWVKQIVDAGLLDLIIPELTPCRGCSQNIFHTMDVFDHTMETYHRLESVLFDLPSLWPDFSKALVAYVNLGNRKALLKWAALLHDVGKPSCRSVDATGRIRFLGHEEASARMAKGICQRLKMSNHDCSFISFMIANHLRPLHLFNAAKQGELTSKGMVRFVKKFQDHAVGLLIHALADQQAKGDRGDAHVAFIQFGDRMLSVYFGDLKPKMKKPGLVSGHDLMEAFKLRPCRFLGRLLEGLEEARLNGEIHTKEEALALAARLIDSV